MNDSILDMIVNATPTEKDDEVLAHMKDLCAKYPFLKEFVLDILFNMILHRNK